MIDLLLTECKNRLTVGFCRCPHAENPNHQREWLGFLHCSESHLGHCVMAGNGERVASVGRKCAQNGQQSGASDKCKWEKDEVREL